MAKKRKGTCHPDTSEYQQEMVTVSLALKEAYDRFNWADDPDLIEACIFEINACKARYNYLLRRVKACSGMAVRSMRAFPVSGSEAQSVPCVAAVNVKGGDTCRS